MFFFEIKIKISTKGVVNRREEGGGRGRGREKYTCPQSLFFWETPFVGEIETTKGYRTKHTVLQ